MNVFIIDNQLIMPYIEIIENSYFNYFLAIYQLSHNFARNIIYSSIMRKILVILYLFVASVTNSFAMALQQTSITGPINGYTGAKYTLSNATGTISWKTSDSQIAAISQDGFLTVTGKGICMITASDDQGTFSIPIAVGSPRYIIKGDFRPNGYHVEAECIDKEFKDVLETVYGAFKFRWGIKYGNHKIEWVESETPQVLFGQFSDNEKCACFLEVINSQGEKLSIQNMDLNSKNIYETENTLFYIDAKGQLYDENKNKYNYSYASVYFSRKKNLQEEYNARLWDAVTALSIDPSGNYKELSINEGSVLIRDMFSKDAIDYMKQNSEENQEYLYMIVLSNYENKSLQYIPIRIVFKYKI